MKKLIIILFMMCFVLLTATCFAGILQDGLYQGEFIMYVDNPVQCIPAIPGSVRITNLENGSILYQLVIFVNNIEIILEEKTCKITGSAIHCPPVDQIIDFTPWGLNAVLTNETDHGAGVILSDTNFKMNHSVKRNYCAGSDCDIVEIWMGIDLPCNVGPWISEFNL